MALFGSVRDISAFRHINRELLGDIITQQVAFYKFKLDNTLVNIYGEASGKKYYYDAVLINCLVEQNDKVYTDTPYGVDLNWTTKFSFLIDDLRDASVVPEAGDIILFLDNYFEVNAIVENQYFAGKDPEHPNEPNPLNPGLSNFGYDVSYVVTANYIPADKVAITKERM